MNKVMLKDVSELITKGTTPSSVGCKFINEGINFIKSESICDSKYLNNKIYEHIDEKTDEKLKRSRIKEGDLLFSIAGAYLGKIAIAQVKDVPANTNQAVGIVRLKRNVVDINFVYYFFSQSNVNSYINKLSSQSSQPNLNLDLLGKLEFELKPIENQQKIAAVLSALDSKIELNNRINIELEAMAKTLYDYWFVQFDFPDADGKPYKNSGGKMVWNEELKRKVPEGWAVVKIGEFGEFKNGINYDPTIKGNVDAKIINVRNISNSNLIVSKFGLDTISLEKSNVQKYLVTERDILIARSGIPGATRIMYDYDENTIYCGFIIRFQVYNLTQKIHLFYQLKDLEKTMTSKSGGTIMPNVNQESLKQMHILMPSERIILNYNSIINPIFKQINNIINENQKLKELRDWLLPMLMNGQIKVN